MTQANPQSKPPSKGTEGIFLVDKPVGISSHGVVNRVRNLTDIRRVGHTGTLDPLASGLMIILVGREYTKLQDSFLKQDKTYTCTAQLGISTNTYDSAGDVTSEADWADLKYIDSTKMEEVLRKFRGKIKQTVPPFSAIKKSGKKLYDLAKKDALKEEELPTRNVEIKKLILTQLKKDVGSKKVFFSIEVEATSGTYIRSLVHDIGKMLGVGAHIVDLRRTKIDNYSVEDAHQVYDPETFIVGEKFLST